MSRRYESYDSRTTIFSPEGRLYQVGYAMEDIGNAGTAIGILSKDGVVLLGKKKVTSKLLQTSTSTVKMYKIKIWWTSAPLGFHFSLLAGKKNFEFQLYTSDPSGNYGGWKAAAVGANNQAALPMLKQDYKDDITREEAVQLALKVLCKTTDSTSLSSDKLELVEVFLLPSGKVKYWVYLAETVSKLQ